MLFTYGSEKIEIRPWGLENSGKALLVTTSEAVKEELLKTRGVTLSTSVASRARPHL